MLERVYGNSYRGWERQGKTYAQVWQNLARVEARMQGHELAAEQLPPAPPEAPVPSWLRRVHWAGTGLPSPCAAFACSPATGEPPLHRCACVYCVPEAHVISQLTRGHILNIWVTD